jgi:hypothetical protein
MAARYFFGQVMRNSSIFFLSILSEAVLLGLLLTQASFSEAPQSDTLEHKASLVKNLRLTDLCLFTEARYTRHLSQSDLNTAFQDHPLSLEHFPSGSFTQPNLENKAP